MTTKVIDYMGYKYQLVEAEPKPPVPKNIKALEKALIDNGKKAGYPANISAYTRYEPREKAWFVGPNVERLGPTFVLKHDGLWFLRDPHSGMDELIHGGFNECMANAEIFYTG